MKKSVFILGSLLVFCACVFLNSSAWSEQQIKIGVATPTKFPVGNLHWNPAVLAAEEINKAGGVTIGNEKYEIQLFKEDSNELMSVVDAVNAVERLITIRGVDFILGSVRSEAALAELEVAADHKKIFMTIGAASPNLPFKVKENYDRYKFWFRGASMNAIDQGTYTFGLIEMVGRAIREQLGIKMPKIGIVAEKALWADPVVKMLSAKLPKLGFEVGPVFRPSAMAMDLSAELSTIKRSGSQIVIFFGAGPVDVTMSRQMGELRIPGILLGTSVDSTTGQHWKVTDGLCNYRMIGNTSGNVEVGGKTKPFWDGYVKKFGEIPGTYTSGVYDSVYAIKGAVERAGTLDSDAVVAEMEKSNFMGAQGRYTFYPVDHKFPHDKPYGPDGATVFGTQWQNGELVVVWPDGRSIAVEKGWEGVRYKGTKDLKLPPWMIEYWKGESGK